MIALLVPPRMKTAGIGRCMEEAFWRGASDHPAALHLCPGKQPSVQLSGDKNAHIGGDLI
jgi:hypothetical protein